MWQDRTRLLIGAEGLAQLHTTHVLVAGLGGVGAMAAEMLCRAGIGKMTLVDADKISTTNRNRQLPALIHTEGRYKTEVMKDRLLAINPALELTVHNVFLDDDTIPRLLPASLHYVVDAIDTLAPKVALLAYCVAHHLPVVSSMGAGAKMDATRVVISDISQTHHCPLAHQLRKRLHRLGIRHGITAVYSAEPPHPTAFEPVDERNKKTTVGTISYLPAVFGCLCAQAVIRETVNEIR